jgi:rsbT antagonist protein RsbS
MAMGSENCKMTEFYKIPIIRLYGNLIVTIQVELSDAVMRQLKEDLTREVERTDAHSLIIDLTGVELMDSYISRAVRDLSVIAKLMGVRAAVCGMRPMVAMTLVEMEMELDGIVTALSLEKAIEKMRALQEDNEWGEELPI